MKYLQVFYYTKRYEISLLEMICKGPVTRRGNLVGGGGLTLFSGGTERESVVINRVQGGGKGCRKITANELPMNDGGSIIGILHSLMG